MSNASGVGLFLRLSMFSCFSVPLKTEFTQNVDFGRQFLENKRILARSFFFKVCFGK